MPEYWCNWCAGSADAPVDDPCTPPPCECETCDESTPFNNGHWDGKKGLVIPMFEDVKTIFGGEHQWIKVTNDDNDT